MPKFIICESSSSCYKMRCNIQKVALSNSCFRIVRKCTESCLNELFLSKLQVAHQNCTQKEFLYIYFFFWKFYKVIWLLCDINGGYFSNLNISKLFRYLRKSLFLMKKNKNLHGKLSFRRITSCWSAVFLKFFPQILQTWWILC